MQKVNNYQIQANRAKKHFLSYDPVLLAKKLGAVLDADYLYVSLLKTPYRVSLTSGDIQRKSGTEWENRTGFEEIMTLLDLICDSSKSRFLSGKWESMENFGLTFHRNLLETSRDMNAERFDKISDHLRQACIALGGREIPGADIGYAIELFDGLEIGLQFWHGDDEFPARLRYLWDKNATMYIRYETMFYAVALLLQRIGEIIEVQAEKVFYKSIDKQEEYDIM